MELDQIIFDTIIIGGGPAGLQAALTLSRVNRKILVIDSQQYRNEKADFLNGLLGHDGIKPAELRRIGREELSKYSNTQIIFEHVNNIIKEENNIIVKTKKNYKTRTVILATGLVDNLPNIPGLKELFGNCIHHCPICDSKDYWGKYIGIHGSKGAEFCLTFKSVTDKIAWFSEGKPNPEETERLTKYGIKIVEDKIIEIKPGTNKLYLIGKNEKGKETSYSVNGLFLSLLRGQDQRSKLAEKMGLEFDKEHGIFQIEGETNIPAVYTCGDASRDVLLSAVALGEGCQVAIKCNNYLKQLDFP